MKQRKGQASISVLSAAMCMILPSMTALHLKICRMKKNTVNKEREQQGGFPFAALFCFRGNSDFKYNKIITHAADVPDSHTFWRIIYIFAAQIPSIVKMMEISKIYP